MASDLKSVPGWSHRIENLLSKHSLTQAALAQRLGVSPTTISRWIRGTHEPTGAAYVSLGNIAGPPEDLYFWERAGIDIATLPQSRNRRTASSMKVRLSDFNYIGGLKDLSSEAINKAEAVAIPLMNLTAYADPIPPEKDVCLSEAAVEEIVMAPISWCTHPEGMMCMHVAGDSMMPLIPPGSIIAVDTFTYDPTALAGKIVLVTHRNLGFKVARLRRLPSADILVSANQKYTPVDITDDPEWKISGQVLWWVSRDNGA